VCAGTGSCGIFISAVAVRAGIIMGAVRVGAGAGISAGTGRVCVAALFVVFRGILPLVVGISGFAGICRRGYGRNAASKNERCNEGVAMFQVLHNILLGFM